MRTQILLSSAITLALSGCVVQPPKSSASADNWVDDQIAQGATAISLAQQRLHSTSAARQASDLTGTQSAVLPTSPPLTSLPSPPGGAAAPVVVTTKAFPITPPTPPTIINVIAAPAVAPESPVKANTMQPVANPGGGVANAHGGPSTAKVGTPAVPIGPPPKREEEWSLSPSDVTLRRALAKWADRAGWQLVWDAPVDVPIQVNAKLKGDFRAVVKKLFLSLSAADVNLTGYLYSGNRVLRVAESGRRAE